MAGPPKRRRPLPGLFGIPRHLVSQLGPRARRLVVAVAALLVVGGIVAALSLGPEIDEAKEREAERREQAEERRLVARRRLSRRVQRAHLGSVPVPPPEAAGAELRADRRRMLDAAGDRVLADARARAARGELAKTGRFVECEPFPRSSTTVDPREDLSAGRGRYACLAITVRRAESEQSAAFSVGYPYRLAVDFESGRFGYCRVVEQPGEGALRGRPLVPLPKACA